MLFQIDVGYACFGIVVVGTTATESAPIGKWMVGKDLSRVVQWVNSKNGSVVPVAYDNVVAI